MVAMGQVRGNAMSRMIEPGYETGLRRFVGPEIYQRNSFHVTGLDVTASARAVRRRAEQARGDERIAEACRELGDPMRRIIDEFFWHWPGYDAHNRAVDAHARALAGPADAVDWAGVRWLWHEAVSEEPGWDYVRDRILQLDEPEIRPDFVDQLRRLLPALLVSVNAALFARAVERGDDSAAADQVRATVRMASGDERLAGAEVATAIRPVLDDFDDPPVERFAAPVLARTVELCRRALAEKNLGRGDIERVILVGGPTLSPFVREYLADPESGLGIALDHTEDPLTVVARGAAIFAGTQRYEAVSAPPVAHGGFALTLDYHPAGPDPDPLIRGSIGPADHGLSIEFGNPESRPPWRSGRVPVAPGGTFATRVLAERGRLNTFQVWLSDALGNRHQVGPDTFTYTVGAVQAEQPLIHSIGIGLADNTLLSLAPKGATLPVRCRAKLHTTTTVTPGVASGVIRIPILEGEQPRADRNRRVGCLEVRAQHISRPLPLGSDIEFIVEIDSSRLVTARAYVPMLDEEFDQVADLESETVPTHTELLGRVSEIRERLASLRSRQVKAGDPVAGMVLMQVDAAGRTETVEQRLAAALDDTDAAQGCDALVRELHVALDEAEDALQWPELVAKARSACADATDIVAAHGNADDAVAMRATMLAIEDAIDTRDSTALRQHTNDLGRLIGQVLDRAGVLQVELFHQLAARRAEMSSPLHADRLIAQGYAALDRDDTAPLRPINSQLFALLPAASQAADDPLSTVRPSY